MTKQDFALKYESGEFDNEETPKRVQKELDDRSRALFGIPYKKTPQNICTCGHNKGSHTKISKKKRGKCNRFISFSVLKCPCKKFQPRKEKKK